MWVLLALTLVPGREKIPGAEVFTGTVAGLHVIVTRPSGGAGKLPLLFEVAWLSCDSVEQPNGPGDGFTQLIWDLAADRPERAIAKGVVTAACSPDGRRLVTGERDLTVRVWDLATGKRVLGPLTGHRDLITGVAFSPDGRYIVTTSRDHDALVWDATSGVRTEHHFLPRGW